MSIRSNRLRQRELLRGHGVDVYAVEAWLRDAGGPTGLTRCIPQLLAVDCGIRGARRAAKALAALATVKWPDGSPLGLYDADLHVWYFAGHCAEHKPRHADEGRSRWRYTEDVPDCEPTRACRAELQPHVERLIADEKSAPKGKGKNENQQDLPLPAPAAEALPKVERQQTRVEWRLVVDEWGEAWRGTSVRTPGPEQLRQMGSLLTQAVDHAPDKNHWRRLFRCARRIAKPGTTGLVLRVGDRRVPVELRTVLEDRQVYAWLLEQLAVEDAEAMPAVALVAPVQELVGTLAARMVPRGTGPPGQVERRIVYDDP